MKDNKQNLTDLIGALAVDIEDVKKKLDAKDSSDKNEALKRLEAKLEPVIRFFNGNAPELWQIIRPDKAISAIRQLWGKVPDGWHKNPYAWAGIGCTLVFFALFIVSWVQWHDYREENRRLRTVADKHHVTTIMLNELHPELAVTVGAYEKLVDVVGVDSTLAIFNRQVKTVREEDNQSKRQK